MTTQLTKYFCHFTKGEYTTPYWLEVTWRKKLLDLTWLEQLCDLKKIAMTWLDSRLEYFWLDLTCDLSKGDSLQHWLQVFESSDFNLDFRLLALHKNPIFRLLMQFECIEKYIFFRHYRLFQTFLSDVFTPLLLGLSHDAWCTINHTYK